MKRFLGDLVSPLHRHLSWLKHKRSLEKQKTNIHVGILATFPECEFGENNRIGDYSAAYKSTFGSYTYYGNHTSIFHAEVGRFCSIGSHVEIGLWEHPVKRNVSTHPVFYSSIGQAAGVVWIREQQEEESKKVTIGHDVWIGNKVLIRGGVHIGTGAVIGAGAVVTKDVPPYAIMGGVPARVLRYRFPEDRIQKLLETCWWEWPDELLSGHHQKFQDVESFLEWAGSLQDNDRL